MPSSATMLSPPTQDALSSGCFDARHVDLRNQLSRQVDVAAAQTRAIGERIQKSRNRGRLSTVAGIAMGVTGLAGSVAVAVETGAVSTLWWLTLPTWIAASTSIVLLLREEGDALPTLHGRAAGVTAVARELIRSFAATSSWAERDAIAAGSIERLSALVDEELKATSLALRERVKAEQPSRRHRRLLPHATKVIVTTSDGRRLRATIADVSLSGVAMTECLPRLYRGDSVLVGQTWAKVIRCWEKGIAFEFETALDPMNFNEGIVL